MYIGQAGSMQIPIVFPFIKASKVKGIGQDISKLI